MPARKTIIKIDIELTDSFESKDVLARVYYPDEGNKIVISKGLNTIELSEAIHHEIGHLMDWYLSKGVQSNKVSVREDNAVSIGESIRFKESSSEPKKQYIRFKDIPKGEKSGVYDGDLGKIRDESGVSCYELVEDKGLYKIILPGMCLGATSDLMRFISQAEDGTMPIYLIQAIRVGSGTYGEPVVKQVEVISKLSIHETLSPKPLFKMDKSSKQLKVLTKKQFIR